MKKTVFKPIFFLFILLLVEQSAMRGMQYPTHPKKANKTVPGPKKHTQPLVATKKFKQQTEFVAKKEKNKQISSLQDRLTQHFLTKPFTPSSAYLFDNNFLMNNNDPIHNNYFSERTDTSLSHDGILIINNNNYVPYDSCF